MRGLRSENIVTSVAKFFSKFLQVGKMSTDFNICHTSVVALLTSLDISRCVAERVTPDHDAVVY